MITFAAMNTCLSDIYPPTTPSSAECGAHRGRGRNTSHFPSAAAADGLPECSQPRKRDCYYHYPSTTSSITTTLHVTAQYGLKNRHNVGGSKHNHVHASETQKPLTSVLGKRCVALCRSTRSGATDLESPEPKRRGCDRALRHDVLDESSFPAVEGTLEEIGRIKCHLRTAVASPRSSESSLSASAAASQGRLLRYKALAEWPATAQRVAASATSRGTTECPTTIFGLLQNIKRKKHATVTPSLPYATSQHMMAFEDGRHVSIGDVAAPPRKPEAAKEPAWNVETPTSFAAVSPRGRHTTFPRCEDISQPTFVQTPAEEQSPRDNQASKAHAEVIQVDARLHKKENEETYGARTETATYSTNPEVFLSEPELLVPLITAVSPPADEHVGFYTTVAALPHQISDGQILPVSRVSSVPFSALKLSLPNDSSTRVSQNKTQFSPAPTLSPKPVLKVGSARKPSAARAPTSALVVPHNTSAATPTAPWRKDEETVDTMQGDFPCKNPTTLKGKEPSWNNLVSLCDLDDAQLTAGADASETADDVSASRLSGYGSGQCEADSSTEEGDANNEDGANGHFGLELGTGLFAMERTEVEGTKKEGIETEGMEEKVSEETCLDGAGKEEQNEGLLTRKDEKNNRDKVADSFIASALLDHEPLALQPSSNPPVFFNYARTTTPASTSLVSASPSACAERTPVAAAACATSASVFLPTPMEPTVPSWHVVTGLPALVLPPPGGYASTSSDDCNCGCSTGYDTGYHTVLNDDCKGDCKGECNSRGSSCLYESTVPPGLPSTPPRHDTMMFPVFPPCGTNSEEQRQFKATAARGTIIGAAQNVFTVKKEEKVDLDADMDADVGADVAADVDASSRATRGYGYSKPGSGGAVPRTAAAMQKSRRRAANRASAKRIRIRQQQHLQKLECETRELTALCKAMRADLAEASRQVAVQRKRNEALMGEKQQLLLLLGER